MAKKIRKLLGESGQIHCACVIHDTLYNFSYVDKLYSMLCRYLSPEVVLHVYTESNRTVPSPYVKHSLIEWPGVRGPKLSWWHKIQIFNPEHYRGRLLYFDLDTVIVNDIDWIWQQDPSFFYGVRDFKYLFRQNRFSINSSVMCFNTEKFAYVYNEFDPGIDKTGLRKYHGDQDYIHEKVSRKHQFRFLDEDRIKSYRWQVKEGGYDFARRKHKEPGAPTTIDPLTSVLIFHGNPKPHTANDFVIEQHWR